MVLGWRETALSARKLGCCYHAVVPHSPGTLEKLQGGDCTPCDGAQYLEISVCVGAVWFGAGNAAGGFAQGIVSMEHVHLVEGGWKMLLSLLSARSVQQGFLRSEKCHLR